MMIEHLLDESLIWAPRAGHAVAAYLSGVGRRLEVLSIVKRKDALGLLAHNDTEELWFGESTTGPGGDVVGATGIAPRWWGRWA
jgi:hypothetical protein